MEALTLTPENILELLATTKQRGVNEATIQKHVDSGELALNVSEVPYFANKSDANAVRNGIKMTIDKKSKDNKWPTLNVVVDRSDKDNHQVILINMDVLAAVQAEAEPEPEA